jgi:dinuclear metal center YbgI/SA1388 family protein
MAIEPELLFGFMDELLGIPEFPDYGPALNGLQVEGVGPVHRVGAAVDAGQAAVDAAGEAGMDLLLVHHGLFWGGTAPLTGRLHRKVASLIRSGTALYSAHLPLDAHPEVGNAAVLIRALGLEPGERFGRYEEVELGFVAETSEDRDDFRDRVAGVVGGPVRLIPGGPARIRRVGVVTGGGGSFIPDAAEAGLDALLTGEGAHHTFLDAMELGVNVFYAGHYATETWGVRALAGKLEAEFGLPWEFLDFPSGL